MDPNADRLLEPARSYDEFYRDEFKKNAEEFFDRLTEKSGIDVAENRRLASAYRDADKIAEATEKKLRRLRAFRTLLIVLIVISTFMLVLGAAGGGPILALISFLIAVVSLILIFSLLNPKIKVLKEQFDKQDEERQKLYNAAMNSIRPLLNRFRSFMTERLIQKTVPTLVLDRYFDMRRYDCLNGKYGLAEDDGPEMTALGLLSGEIVGNPFLFERVMQHRMGVQTYTGTLTIHWTTTGVDSNGKRVTRHHTQVLHASVQKPKPFYRTVTHLLYGSDAASELSFTHRKTHAETFSESKMRSFVKSRVKKVRAYAEKHVEQGFTPTGNDEFDALFGAMDRDDEVKFRMLFTPLAQKNMLHLMKGGSPYGDDFDLIKRNCLNYVISDHAQSWNPDMDPSTYYSYDVDLCRNLFVQVNAAYFQSMFFDLAPLLSIPLYQQHKPEPYTYRERYHRAFTAREAEVMANKLGQRALAHPRSVTPAILKTSLSDSRDGVDKVRVSAFSYRTVRRVDFIPQLGGDGRIHSVPVPWLQYIPLQKESEIELKASQSEDEELVNGSEKAEESESASLRSVLVTLMALGNEIDSAPNEEDSDTSEYGDVTEEGGNEETPDNEFDD